MYYRTGCIVVDFITAQGHSSDKFKKKKKKVLIFFYNLVTNLKNKNKKNHQTNKQTKKTPNHKNPRRQKPLSSAIIILTVEPSTCSGKKYIARHLGIRNTVGH